MPTCLNSLELNSVLCANRPLFSTLYKSEANIVEITADYLLKSCVQLGALQQLLAGGNLRFTVQILHANVTGKSGQPFQCLRASESCCRRGWFSLFWLSSGMYWDMMDMISESMYDLSLYL